MQWSEAIKECIKRCNQVASDAALIKRVISLVDLTSLNSTDTEESIAVFLEKAQTLMVMSQPFVFIPILFACARDNA